MPQALKNNKERWTYADYLTWLADDGLYGKPDRYAGNDKVAVPLLGDLVVDLNEVFSE